MSAGISRFIAARPCWIGLAINEDAPDQSRSRSGAYISNLVEEIVMHHDFIRLANEMRRAHALGEPFRLPAMTVRELGTLIALLLTEAPASTLLH